MVAYMDAEALAATIETGEVHFHSRSRDRLWRKGETSGNVLRVVDLAIDCDGDALLVSVEPAGPTCHRGTRSCFDPDGAPSDADDAGLRLARDAVGDDRRASRHAPGGLVHRRAARGRRRCGRPQGHRGSDRGAPRRPRRRRGRAGRRRARPRRARHWPAKRPTCSITPSSCSRNVASSQRPSSTRPSADVLDASRAVTPGPLRVVPRTRGATMIT